MSTMNGWRDYEEELRQRRRHEQVSRGRGKKP